MLKHLTWVTSLVSVACPFVVGCSSEISGFESKDNSEVVPTESETQVCDEVAGLTFTQRMQKPDIFLALDKSGSMESPLEEGGVAKLQIMASAIADVVAENHLVPFGLIRFPHSGCNQNGVDISPSEPNNGELLRIVGRTGASGKTPIAGVLRNLRTTHFETQDDDTQNQDGQVVLLATDGIEACNGNPVLEVERLADLGIRTFVLGFGDGAADADSLQAMAVAGGTTRTYFSDTPESLNIAFESILGEVTELSCVFDLSNVPENYEEITITIDGQEVNQSTEDGWAYDASNNQVRLNGDACDSLKNTQPESVEVGLGCARVTIE